MIRTVFAGSLLGLALLAQPAAAQARRVSYDRIPPGQLPPAGMCRVWYDGVPAGRQPRVTDCRTARYQASRHGGRVIYGDDYARPGKGKAKGKYKHDDRRDDRYGRRDRDDDRWDRDRRDDDRDGRYDDRDGRYGDRDGRYGDRDGRWDGRRDDDRRNGSSTCVDANRDGRCDVSQTTQSSKAGVFFPRGSTQQSQSKPSPSQVLRDKFGVKAKQ